MRDVCHSEISQPTDRYWAGATELQETRALRASDRCEDRLMFVLLLGALELSHTSTKQLISLHLRYFIPIGTTTSFMLLANCLPLHVDQFSRVVTYKDIYMITVCGVLLVYHDHIIDRKCLIFSWTKKGWRNWHWQLVLYFSSYWVGG